ncbi:MAG TPA: metallophosphoesterase [Nocardioidaceae bacterium]|nr:metallophosphoesterase [Nocardioidaceae bacterium]
MPFPSRPVARRVLRYAAATGAAGVACLGYAAAVEVRWFVLRELQLPVLPAGKSSLSILHLSDLHLTPTQRRKRDWLRGLSALDPDLVVCTGDMLAHRDAVRPVLEALDGLLDVPGVFVLGSNDYFSPAARNPARYLFPDSGQRNTHTSKLPWQDLVAGLERRGWVGLANRRDRLRVRDVDIAFAGVDDPHLGYDDLAAVAGPADAAADLRLAVSHAPYLRVLDQFARDGYDAIVSGHTHGGQLCLPGGRALVTNCDLEPARARGLHRHPAWSPVGVPGSAWLHVSAGLGTSPYAPVRFCCRPEATLLRLTATQPE